MRGSYYLRLRNKRIVYDIKIERNITIIKGNSGTGKTNLISMLDAYLEEGRASGVHLETDISSVRILENKTDWEYDLPNYPNSVYFADEHVEYVLTKKFCDLLHVSGSYLVYITRSSRTGFLQYSISSIMEFKSEFDGHLYTNRLYNIYNNEYESFTPDIVITEDSTSGLDILSHGLKVNVISSYGKDNIVNKLDSISSDYSKIYIIVDGAAFGNQIQSLFSLIKSLTSCKILIFAPESFEYLILNTSRFSRLCKNELSDTSNYVDSSIHKTWENYFEDLLIDLCKNFNHVKYEKVSWNLLNPFSKSQNLIREITSQLKDLSPDIKL